MRAKKPGFINNSTKSFVYHQPNVAPSTTNTMSLLAPDPPRVYVKSMLRYVPIIGWAWAMSDTVFLERDWGKDQQILREGMERLQVPTSCPSHPDPTKDYPSPCWVLLFPEGTRRTPDKLEAGRQFSVSRGLQPLEHCLVPRTKGFSLTIASCSPSTFPWLYDVTLACPGGAGVAPPTLTSCLLGRSTEAHLYIR